MNDRTDHSARPLGARLQDTTVPTWEPPATVPPRERAKPRTVTDIRARVRELCAEPHTVRSLTDATGARSQDVRNAVQSLRASGVLARVNADDEAPAVYQRTAASVAEAERPRAPALEAPLDMALAELEDVLAGPRFHVERLELKRETLRRLAEILDPSIAEVLRAIEADLAAVSDESGP